MKLGASKMLSKKLSLLSKTDLPKEKEEKKDRVDCWAKNEHNISIGICVPWKIDTFCTCRTTEPQEVTSRKGQESPPSLLMTYLAEEAGWNRFFNRRPRTASAPWPSALTSSFPTEQNDSVWKSNHTESWLMVRFPGRKKKKKLNAKATKNLDSLI